MQPISMNATMQTALNKIDNKMLHVLRTVYLTSAMPHTEEGQQAVRRLQALGFMYLDKQKPNKSGQYCRLTPAGFHAVEQLIAKKNYGC